MRVILFGLCTFLSSFGFVGTALFLQQSFRCGEGSFSSSCEADIVMDWAGLWIFLICCCAWFVYFKMGSAWIRCERLGQLWPTLGTVFGVLALNRGGLAFFRVDYNPSEMIGVGIFVLPAIILAFWMVGYHLKSQN